MRKLVGSIFVAFVFVMFAPSFFTIFGVTNNHIAHAQFSSNPTTYTPTTGDASSEAVGFTPPSGSSDAALNPNVCPSWLDVGCKIGVFLIYNVFYYFTNLGASLTAGFADITLWYSLQSWTYSNSDFISAGWTILRDLANIAFIAGLLYAAFQLIMGDGAGQKTVAKVVIFALVINFSLFISRVIVDGGNILARSIYQSIEVTGVTRTFDQNEGKRGISAGIVSIANPQRIIFSPTNSTALQPNDPGYLSTYLFIFALAGVLNILMMFMFIKIALTFVGRTVGIMILMIVSPLTVFSKLLPVEKFIPVKYLTLEGWFTELFELTIMAPVYVFFLYLIILFWGKSANGAAFQVANAGSDWMSSIIMLSVPLLLTFMLFKAASDTVQKLSGELGGMIAGAAGAALGAVVGVVSAATGMVGGAVIGGIGGKLVQKIGGDRAANIQKDKDEIKKLQAIAPGARTDAEKERLAKLNSVGSRLGRNVFDGKTAMNVGTSLRKANFDVRDLKVGGFNVGKHGMQEMGGLGNFYGVGGIESTGSSKELMEKMAAKQVERINNQSAIIEESIRARTEKERLEVRRHEASPNHQEAIESAEKEKEKLEKGDGRDRAAAESFVTGTNAGTNTPPTTVQQDAIIAELGALSVDALKELETTLKNNAKTTPAEKARYEALAGLVGNALTKRNAAIAKKEKQIKSGDVYGLTPDDVKTINELNQKMAQSLTQEQAKAYADLVNAQNATLSAAEQNQFAQLDAAQKAGALTDPAQVAQHAALQARRTAALNPAETATLAALEATRTAALGADANKYHKANNEREKLRNDAGKPGGLAYIENKAKIEANDKLAKKVARSYEQEEYENLTKIGQNIGKSILKGLALGALTGGAVSGFGSLAAVASSAARGAALGGVALGAISTATEVDKQIARALYAAHGRDWKLEIRDKLRNLSKPEEKDAKKP